MPDEEQPGPLARLPQSVERLVSAQLTELPRLPSIHVEEELPQVVVPLRGIIELERKTARAREGERWAMTIEVTSQSGALVPLAGLLRALDREMRRLLPLRDALRRREVLFSLPRPMDARAAGLHVSRASSGSLDLWLDPYGALVAFAQTNPISVISMMQTLWSLGRLPRGLFRSWAILRDGRAQAIRSGGAGELPHVVVKELAAVSREAIRAGHDKVAWEVVGPDIKVKFVASRTQ